jgi:HD-GYP domain-containing protein (c-di-GMP phosphodiesterase class II)/DNA-binding CsgD family transcriptional regulator
LIRLADLLAGLSRLADLGYGLQSGEALRSGALAVTLARSLDLPDDDVRAAMYAALLTHVGCVGFAHETAQTFGNEHVWNVAAERADLASLWDVYATFVPMVTRGLPPLERARRIATMFAKGRRHGEEYVTATCEVGQEAARRLGLPEDVQRSVYHSLEWWNGGGGPEGLAGDNIPVGARVAMLTTSAVYFDDLGGVDAAIHMVRQRAGGILDPSIADHFADRAESLLGEVNTTDPHQVVLDGEPRPVASVLDPHLVDVAAVFGEIADLKSPYTHGHSRGVALLAEGAGEQLGLPATDVANLELAGLLHDVGRVVISTTIWEKPDALTTHEWEQVRLHPYHSERILVGSERLGPLAKLVGAHHERCDASGYHRGSSGTDLSMPARVLAAADAFQAMTQVRPHRPALRPEQAEQALLDEARTGLLDTEAVSAVLAAAGHDATVPRSEPPAGLTDREVEVLRLVADGCSNREIADRLVISRRTAEHHVQNIYAKIGLSSRAAAALFAMEHGLLER